jgi:hypothetical protein
MSHQVNGTTTRELDRWLTSLSADQLELFCGEPMGTPARAMQVACAGWLYCLHIQSPNGEHENHKLMMVDLKSAVEIAGDPSCHVAAIDLIELPAVPEAQFRVHQVLCVLSASLEDASGQRRTFIVVTSSGTATLDQALKLRGTQLNDLKVVFPPPRTEGADV